MKPATEAQIAKLKTLGYRIQDMQAEYGDGWWDGLYRWVNEENDEVQDHFPCETEAQAWAVCAHYVFVATGREAA